MSVSSPRILAGCIAIGVGIAAISGSIYALFADVTLLYAIATSMFVVGLIAFGLGLLGATEPPGGWVTSPKRDADGGRRSFIARLAGEHPSIGEVTAPQLAVWGLLVGGGLVALSMLVFGLDS